MGKKTDREPVRQAQPDEAGDKAASGHELPDDWRDPDEVDLKELAEAEVVTPHTALANDMSLLIDRLAWTCLASAPGAHICANRDEMQADLAHLRALARSTREYQDLEI